MTEKCKSVNINGEEYIRADLAQKATEKDGKPFVIIRSYGAGVFAGYLQKRTADGGQVSVIMDGCIRMHRWTGCSLSQVANDGIAGSGENRFAMPTENHEINNVIEILSCKEKARIAIQGVKTWKL